VSHLTPGVRVGDYVVDAEQGVEGAGVVYAATHVVLPRRAAVKVMHENGARATAMQLVREACLLEALACAGIPRVFECGVLPDRRPWVAFELVEGPTIAAMVGDGVPLPLVDVVIVLRDVAEMLRHVHARGVVHRALDTEAIIRAPQRTYVRRWDQALTIDSESGASSSVAEDVQALGAVAFRCLTGKLFDGTATAAASCPNIPTELVALIDRMLDDDLAAVPASDEVHVRARWLADTLEPLLVDAARWTPQAKPVPVDDVDSGFTVRISRR
jgi:serine/threonine protein kinase